MSFLDINDNTIFVVSNGVEETPINKDMYEVKRSGLKNIIEMYEEEIHRDFYKRLEDAILYFEMVKQPSKDCYVDNYEGILLIYSKFGDTFYVPPEVLVNKLIYGERDRTEVRNISKPEHCANFSHKIFHWNQVAEYYLRQIGAKSEQKD